MMYHVNENLSPLLRLDSFTTLQKAGHWKASKNMVSGSEADLEQLPSWYHLKKSKQHGEV